MIDLMHGFDSIRCNFEYVLSYRRVIKEDARSNSERQNLVCRLDHAVKGG
jgi:hypothetical protein